MKYDCMEYGSDNSVDLAFEWDPTEPVATRPLFMQQRNHDGNPSNYFFTHDGNKNVSEVVSYQRARGRALSETQQSKAVDFLMSWIDVKLNNS